MTIELGINQRWEEDGAPFTRNIGLLIIDETYPAVPVQVLQTIDGTTLSIVLRVLTDMAKEQQAALTALIPEG